MTINSDKRLVCIKNINSNEIKRVKRNLIGEGKEYSIKNWEYTTKKEFKNFKAKENVKN